jgi:uncharacterized protein YqjF (DUF2071 family)
MHSRVERLRRRLRRSERGDASCTMTTTTYEQAQADSLGELEHRPWPLSRAPWVMGQTWERLLFAHWRVSVEQLRLHVPSRLEIEEFDGSAWIAATPFRIEGLRVRGIPALPRVSSLCELNCRTYVLRGERPGIWFFSLDASNLLAAQTARLTYGLPYHYASITFDDETFAAEREGGDMRFTATYRATGDAFTPEPGTLEHFLVERYCLYGGGGRLRSDIHHRPWSIRPAEAEIEEAGLFPVEVEGEPLLHLAERQDVVIWPPAPVR